MLRKFLSFFMTGDQFKKLTQDQNEALMEILAMAIVIDGDVSAEELSELGKSAKLLTWQREDQSAEEFVEGCFADAEAAREGGHEALRARLQAIVPRLEEEWLREEAYYMSALITSSDASIEESERSLLNLLVEELGIRRERLEFITHKIMKEQSF